MEIWEEGNFLLSQERDLRWLVNMVAMFRCVDVFTRRRLGSWGAGKIMAGAGDRRTTLAASRLASILSDLLSHKKFRATFSRMIND